jgi:ribosomal protein S12 methylthiotransferase accessory factor
MLLKRLKPYKAKRPDETIEWIQSIFTGLGFLFFMKPLPQESLFHSCILSLIHPLSKRRIFSTYGKGVTAAWALASAWGEMMERFENLAFFMIHMYPSQPENGDCRYEGFKYYPDEQILEASENGNGSIGVPFHDLLNNEVTYFPFRALQVLVGSNGMCSGNTKEEALVQGLSEVFERYVLKTLYLSPICPPDIAMEYFDGSEIQSKINWLISRKHYTIRVKDCSLGKGYPVIGVLIRNKEMDYAFHLGADPSPITALERCLTEMFQGGEICFLSKEELARNSHYDLHSDFWKSNFSQTISAYKGHWPPEVLLTNPSYAFTGFDHPSSISDDNDLDYLLNILRREKRQVFVRDNSFLGQPAYSVFIPGMSEITSYPDPSFFNVYLEFDAFISTLTNIPESNSEERAGLLKKIHAYSELSPNNEFRSLEYFSFFREHPVAQFSGQQITSLLEGTADLFNDLDIPSCFNCQNCTKVNLCNFPFIRETWEQVKVRMLHYYDSV